MTRVGDVLALAVASVVLPLAVIGTSYFCWYKTNQQTFWSWTCDHTQVDHPEVQFKMVCGEVVSFLVLAVNNIHYLNYNLNTEVCIRNGLGSCCSGVFNAHQCLSGVCLG